MTYGLQNRSPNGSPVVLERLDGYHTLAARSVESGENVLSGRTESRRRRSEHVQMAISPVETGKSPAPALNGLSDCDAQGVPRAVAVSICGPCSSPLYFTALSLLPTRLLFAGLSEEDEWKLVIGPADKRDEPYVSEPTRCIRGLCSWSIESIALHRDTLYRWRVIRADNDTDGDLGDIETSYHAMSNPGASPVTVREGRFWGIASEELERISRCRKRLETVADDHMIPIATALFMAEIGLYHEALCTISSWLQRGVTRKYQVLAYTVRALIYKEMQLHLKRELRDRTADANLYGTYSCWSLNRELKSRDRAVALMKRSSSVFAEIIKL